MELEKQENTRESGLLEAAFYQSVANACPQEGPGCTAVAGFVGSAPLEAGNNATKAYLAEMVALYPSVKGVREGLWTKPGSFFTDPSFIGGG